MADKEKEVKTDTPKEENGAGEVQPEVVIVPKKKGLGTAAKIAGGLLLTTALTGLGWILRGIFGGGSADEEKPVETEGTVE